jgi:superfamily I DNA/RNA helicase
VKVDISTLNPAQREAVMHQTGPMLVLAGAGSGKTRVVTTRIARLILEGTDPRSILAVTFTNKAAKEMKERVLELVGSSRARGIVVSTFHALCARILRADGHRMGLDPRFSILDTSDQLSQLIRVARDEEIVLDEKMPRIVLGKIGGFKNQGLRPTDPLPRSDELDIVAAKLYRPYAAHLRALSAVDFDDLLLLVRDLLEAEQDVRERYQLRFRHLLIDEYQDTNPIQLALVHLLTGPEQNLCVVGDDDQAIYGFRGATVQNILEFDQQFDACRIVKLEQNYRSTGAILRVANAVIAKTPGRRDKTMFTDGKLGDLPEVVVCDDGDIEAEFVAETIAAWLATGERKPDDIALLYRANPQSRLFEEQLRLHAVPYRVVGGQEFLERREVKDVLSYVRLIARPKDELAFRRVVNLPARGLGEGAVKKILTRSKETGKSPLELGVTGDDLGLRAGARDAFRTFCLALETARAEIESMDDDDDPSLVIERAVQRAGWVDAVRKEPELKRKERCDEALEEIVTALSAFWTRVLEAREAPDLADSWLLEEVDDPLAAFLDRMTLQGDKPDKDKKEENTRGKVTLMSLHASKGLEFPVVFFVGFEDGFMPHRRAIAEGDDGEHEERRLCYVGVTRARERLFMTYATARRRRNKIIGRRASRFLGDVPEDAFCERKPVVLISEEDEAGAAAGFFAQMKSRFEDGGAG